MPEGQDSSCKIASCIVGREAAPTKSQNCGHLNKICTMTTLTDMLAGLEVILQAPTLRLRAIVN